MSVSILAPHDGDTVTSPVTVSVAYSVGSTSCVLTAAVGPFPDPSPPTVSGDGTISPSITVTTPGVYTVTATTNPDVGSDSQPNVTVTVTGGDFVTITDISPEPPPPPPPPMIQAAANTAAKSKFKVKGKAKDQGTPIPNKITCKAYKVDVTTNDWTEVDSQDDTPSSGNWKVTLSYVKEAGYYYVARAFAYDGTTPLGSFSMYNDK